MFTKKDEQEIYTVFSTSVLPANLKQKNQLIWIQLYEVVSLIKLHYGLENEDVKGRLDLTRPDHISILLFNSSYGPDVPDVDETNIQPIEFLKKYDVSVAKEDTCSYWSNSMIILKKHELRGIIEDLLWLIEPHIGNTP